MADDLEQQIDNCKKRIAVIGTLIEEQRAAGLITAEAARPRLGGELPEGPGGYAGLRRNRG
ncbi:MAG: hypothetical protein EHM67_03015 [Hyphomicrobiaceae bacterium]|nr:MAG: hypothetical protein EHM67_03015 [Hyphomicrobiaceae bacterium]